MSVIILGQNPEQYESDWLAAVLAVQSLKNVVWQAKADPLGGTAGGGNEVCFVGSTRDIRMVKPATVDYFIQGTNPLGFAAALNLATLFNGVSQTNFFLGQWNGTMAQNNQIADEYAMGAVMVPWS